MRSETAFATPRRPLLSAGVEIWQGSWTSAIRRSDITPVNGRVYTLVVLGPAVAPGRRDFWNPIAVTLVDNDPALQ